MLALHEQFCIAEVIIAIIGLIFLIALVKYYRRTLRFKQGRYATPDGKVVIDVFKLDDIRRDTNYIVLNGRIAFVFDFAGDFTGTNVKNPTPEEAKMYQDYFADWIGDAWINKNERIITDIKGYREYEEVDE